ncbi:MAG: hypothetical protein QM755_09535 [Luteolibacter sp.]
MPLFCAVALAEEPPGPSWIRATGDAPKSPDGRIRVEHYMEKNVDPHSGPEHQIWLVDSANPTNRRKLYVHGRQADVIFSPDSRYLVINDHEASNQSSLVIFKRKDGLDYEKADDITTAAWAFFCKKNQCGDTGFDHAYVDALLWLDEHTLLLDLSGHADSRNHTSGWHCLYDLKTKSFSTSFDSGNRENTRLE